MNNKKSLTNGSLFSLFSFLNQGIGFVLLIILAKYILPDDYGKLSLYNIVVMFLGYFVGLSSQGYLSVSFFKNTQNEFVSDVSSILDISLISTFVFFVIWLLGGNKIGEIFQLPSYFILYAILVTLFNFVWNLYLDYLRVREKILLYGIGSCGYAIGNFLFSLLFVIAYNQNWAGRVYSQILCTLVCGILGFFVLYNKKVFVLRFYKKNIYKVALWGIPLIPHLATIWIKQGCDRLIINEYYSLTEVGVFSFALTLMSVIVALGMAFNSSFSVTIYKILSSDLSVEEKKRQVNTQEHISIYVFLIAVLAIIVVSYFLVPLFLKQYESSLVFFYILALSGFFQCLYFVYSNVLFYNGKNKQIMYITFICSIIHLFLSLLMTRYSLYITCSIYAITQFLVLVFVIIYNKKILSA